MNVKFPTAAREAVPSSAPMANATKDPQTAERFIPVDAIDIHPAAHRPVPEDKETFERERQTLTLSVRENGLLQAVLVRPIGDRFELIDGSRRFAAVRAAGQTRVRATVRPMTDAEAMELAGVSNMLRRDWDLIKRSEFIARLATTAEKSGAGMSKEDIARRFGHSVSWVKNTIRLARLPEPWRSQVAAGELAERTARLLIPHIDKPAVLKAIEINQEQDPKRWRVNEDWKANIDFVVDQLEQLHEEAANEGGNEAYEQSATLGRERKAAEPKEWVEERIAQQSDKLAESLTSFHKDGDQFAAAPEGPLSPELAKQFLAPFWGDREDLQMLSAIASQRALELRK